MRLLRRLLQCGRMLALDVFQLDSDQFYSLDIRAVVLSQAVGT